MVGVLSYIFLFSRLLSAQNRSATNKNAMMIHVLSMKTDVRPKINARINHTALDIKVFAQMCMSPEVSAVSISLGTKLPRIILSFPSLIDAGKMNVFSRGGNFSFDLSEKKIFLGIQ